jgi:hypothetical protein
MLRLTALLLLLSVPAHANDEVRAEMATYGAIYGLGLGAWTSAELDLNLRPAAWVTAATTTGGVFGGLALTDGLQLTLGQGRLIASAGLWSAFDWLMLAGEIGYFDESVVWLTFAAAAAGAGGSILAASQGFEPSAADISLMNSGGIWMVPAGLLFGFTAHLGSGEHIFRDVLLLNLAGLGTGIALAHRYDPSRTQVLYLDAGILAGGVTGGLLGLILGVPTKVEEIMTGVSFLGMVAGGWIAIELAGFNGGSADAAHQTNTNGLAVPMPLWAGTW